MTPVPLGILASAKAGTALALTGFLQATGDASNLTTYTFASQNFGGADPTRQIIVAVGGFGSSGRTLTSVTVGGVTATAISTLTALASSQRILALYRASVPTGTSGNVVVTFSNGMTAAGIALWSVVGTAGSITPTTNSSSLGVGTTIATTVTGVAGGFIIHAFQDTGALSGASVTWTNATERYDTDIESGNILFSGADSTTTGSVTTTVTLAATNGLKQIISAVFAP